jgi:hypothetical protein
LARLERRGGLLHTRRRGRACRRLALSSRHRLLASAVVARAHDSVSRLPARGLVEVRLTSEFKAIAEVAGLGSGGGGGGGGRGGAGGGEKFDPDDPTTAGLLIRTLQQNESRNESTHAYLESLEATVSLLEEEHGALDSEAASLIATEERASTEAAAVRENDEKRRQAEVEDERRCESLEARLLAIRPSLSGCVARLGKHVESLDFPESTNAIEREGLTPLPARSLPAGLQPPPKDALPLHTSLELELEGLDGLL